MTRDGLARALASRRGGPAWGFSDDGDSPQPRSADRLIPAAVLIAVINRPQGPSVLFTQRTAHLREHAGQISFPGGRVDPGDRDAVHTALREAEEEVGLPASKVEILGEIPAYTTGTGFSVTPVVGWVEPPFALSLDAFEVAEVFEAPFRFLMDPANHRIETGTFRGRVRTYYAVPYEGRYIWGATAGMLVSLHRLIAQEPGLSGGAQR